LKVDDLRNAIHCKIFSSERRSEATSKNRKLSIFDLQFFFFGSRSSGLVSGVNHHPVLPIHRAGPFVWQAIIFSHGTNKSFADLFHAVRFVTKAAVKSGLSNMLSEFIPDELKMDIKYVTLFLYSIPTQVITDWTCR
jgi:hypothetical protein